MSKKSGITACLSLYIAYLLYVMASSCNNPSDSKKNTSELSLQNQRFVGQQQCQSCHKKEFNDWKQSDHFLAMQAATDSTVLGDFNNTSFTADGVTSRFYRKDGKYYINTEGDDGKNHDFEVMYTFGYFPLQQYLIAFPGGRFQSSRVSWDSREKKWFHQYKGQKLYHKDWLHWTGNSQNWNTMCASCHSTDLQKNYSIDLDTYKTTWKEMNVSCESCHGPGGNHLDFINSTDYKEGTRIKNSGFNYAKDTISQLQLNTCAPCHARKSDISSSMIHSDEIMDDYIPQIISDEFYFADGQIKEEDYEYGSFTQSKMFHNNVRCSNCHNPHSGKLKKIGNDLCTSCHSKELDTKEHYFHAPNTAGAQCVNCHMAEKTYMGVDHRRDHSFRIPRPDQSLIYGTPNACNNCHKEKSVKWTSDAINRWYGTTRKHHFSDDLIPGSKLDNSSEQHLIKLLNDTSEPAIARATAANYLGNILTQQSANTLLFALKDREAIVRYNALKSLEKFNSKIWIEDAAFCLKDKVRAVRIAAADLFHKIPTENIPGSFRSAYDAADAENRSFLNYQTDFSVGNVMLADYELQGGKQLDAIKYYLRGLQKDSLMNYARLNLASAYNAIGKNFEAQKTLETAALIDPLNERIFYNLGLLYYEIGNIPAALSSFKKAVDLRSNTVGLYYNYGLLLQQQGNVKEAEQILLKGYQLDSQALNINYALTYLYMQQKSTEKARDHVKILKQNDPNNPDYQILFKQFGL